MSKYKTVKRNIVVCCPTCSGLGIMATNNGAEICPRCFGTGEIVKVVNEIVHGEEEEDARQNK